MTNQTNFEVEGIDVAPTLAAGFNLSAPFLNVGVINIDAMLEIEGV